jgi:hypothetical protein
MEAERSTPMRELTEGGLAGLADLPFGELDAQGLILALTVMGDALRLAMPVPSSLAQRAMREVSQGGVELALEALRTEVQGWALPAALRDEDDPTLAATLRRRDEVESFFFGLRRVLLPRGVVIEGTSTAKALREALARLDLGCGDTVSRTAAERLLGPRRELVAERSWLDDARWAPEPADASNVPGDELSPEMVADLAHALATPSFDTLVRYATRGHLAKWVEAAAARSPEVAEDLLDIVRTYEERGSPLSLKAAVWARSRGGARSTPGPVVLPVRRPLERLAAADEAELPRDEAIEHPLGALAPVDAEASLTLRPREITLHVFPGQKPLTSVTLDGHAASREDGSHTWSVSLPFEGDAPRTLSLTVVDLDGARFEATFQLATP